MTLNIVQKRGVWFSLSLVIIAIGLSLMTYRLFLNQPILNWGLDFTGGSSILLEASDSPFATPDTAQVQAILVDAGITQASTVQLTAAQHLIIKTSLLSAADREALITRLNTWRPVIILEADTIGPSISRTLKRQSLLMTAIVVGVLLLYITWRFQWRYSIAAILALVHDAGIIISAAAITGLEINTGFIAALLMILGYSLNDTIVIIDRVRDLQSQPDSLVDSVNQAIVGTFRRSLYTSLTTAFVIIALLIWGGESIRDFSWVILIGILSGTYSSNLIACPMIITLSTDRA